VSVRCIQPIILKLDDGSLQSDLPMGALEESTDLLPIDLVVPR
jgi:hypothetical protein